jgi:hypothetical protein
VPAAEAVLMALVVARFATKVRAGAAVQQQQGGAVEAIDWAPQPATSVWKPVFRSALWRVQNLEGIALAGLCYKVLLLARRRHAC